jgi:nitrous oxidase accessory protein
VTRGRLRAAAAGVAVAAFWACGVGRPGRIVYGGDACAHCHMTIVDPRFAAQLITPKGKALAFDDIGCLITYARARLPGVPAPDVWVNDFLSPDSLLEGTHAVFLQADSIATPMGSHLLALRPGPRADSLRAALGARLLTWAQVYVLPLEQLSPRPVDRVEVPRVPTGREIVVDPRGAVSTVTAALALARPGDLVRVRPGVYREPRLVIDKRLELVGEDGAVLDGQNAHEVVTVTADSVVIRGFTVRNVGVSFTEDRAGIRLDGVRGCAVEDNRLVDTFFGIYAAKAADCRIAGNRIRGAGTTESASGNGIHLWYSSGMVVENNEVRGHRDGIYLEFSQDATIRHNLSAGNLRYGLHFMFSHGCRYFDNIFTGNGAGVAVMYSRRVTMARNRFEQSRGSAAFGLLLKDLSESDIDDNVFADNTVGLYAEGTTGSRIEGNAFLRNGWAVKILADATDNRFLRNRFIGNSFDVATNSTASTSEFSGNYWDHYDGYDLDRDGRGDVPFHPVRLFSLLVQQNEPALILLRSPFVDLLDAAERALPVLTPETLVDQRPLIRWPQ